MKANYRKRKEAIKRMMQQAITTIYERVAEAVMYDHVDRRIINDLQDLIENSTKIYTKKNRVRVKSEIGQVDQIKLFCVDIRESLEREKKNCQETDFRFGEIEKAEVQMSILESRIKEIKDFFEKVKNK